MSKVIGILGGGQLAKMLCDSAKKMGYKTVIYDPQKEVCGNISADYHIAKDYFDEEGLKEFAEKTDVITYEFENVPSRTIDILDSYKANIPQGKNPLYLSQHRVREKESVQKLGVTTAKFKQIGTVAELKDAIETVGLPSILKTCSGGYDGKGQWVLKEISDLEKIELKEGKEYILEQMVNFKVEVSCLVIRNLDGEVITFPIGENHHKNGILHTTIVPTTVGEEVEENAKKIAEKIITGLDFVGPLGIEFFVGENDEIYFNEMAPRPHNSAHYTMDACDYSQFDLHIKSLVEKKLEEPKLLTNVIMLNILGEDKERLEKNKISEKNIIHIYGKKEWKYARKMGHINFIGKNLKELEKEVNNFLMEE